MPIHVSLSLRIRRISHHVTISLRLTNDELLGLSPDLTLSIDDHFADQSWILRVILIRNEVVASHLVFVGSWLVHEDDVVFDYGIRVRHVDHTIDLLGVQVSD